LNPCLAIEEQQEQVLVTATTCPGIQEWCAKQNATTQQKLTWRMPNKSSKLECTNISVKPKDSLRLERNPSYVTQCATKTHPPRPNVKESPSTSSDEATTTAQSKQSL